MVDRTFLMWCLLPPAYEKYLPTEGVNIVIWSHATSFLYSTEFKPSQIFKTYARIN